MEKQTKFQDTIVNAVASRDSKDRTMTFVVSDENINRYGHKVMVSGWDLTNYKKNPVVLVNHSSGLTDVVGKSVRVWKDTKNKKLMAKVQFVEEGVSPIADLAFYLYDNDYLNSTSPGYMVDYEKAEFGKTEKDPKVTFNGQELYEVSLAVIPANTEARKQNIMELDYIKDALELEIIDEELVDRVVNQLQKPHVTVKLVEDIVKEDVEVVEDPEQTINSEDILDVDSMDDPYEDFYKALDEINQEQRDNDPDYLLGKLLEGTESNDSNSNSDEDFDAWLGEEFVK